MKLIPSLPSYQNDEAAKATWNRLADSPLGDTDGVAYYKHPIIISSSDEAPDFVFLGRGYEPGVVKVVPSAIDNVLSASASGGRCDRQFSRTGAFA